MLTAAWENMLEIKISNEKYNIGRKIYFYIKTSSGDEVLDKTFWYEF